jgi:hypothetical protein
MMKVWDRSLGYLVEWSDGVESWEKRTDLLWRLSAEEKAHVDGWCNLIDRFMQSDQEVLVDFLRIDRYGQRFFDTAGLDGLCGFRAVEYALEYLGAPRLVDDNVIRDFCEELLRRTHGKIDAARTGLTPKQLRGFVRTLGVIDMAVFDQPVYKGGRPGWRGVRDVIHEDGVYLMSGKSDMKTGHVMAIKKCGDFIYARDERGETPIEQQSWIDSISYIKKFEREGKSTVSVCSFA